MKRFLALGCGLFGFGLATAGNPVPQPPVRQVGCADVNGSLAQVLATSLPTTPTVPPPSACAPCPPGHDIPCGTPLFSGVGRRSGDRTCLTRLKEWLCFQPGPRVLPILTPTPYHAPIRAYFPCKPDVRRAACPPACQPSGPAAPLLGFRLVNAGCGPTREECPRPLFGGQGLFDRSQQTCYPAAYSPSPYACSTCSRCGTSASLLDRLLEFLVPGRSECAYARWGHETAVPEMTYGSVSGATPAFSGPMMAGYRFALPGGHPVGLGQPAAMGAYPVVAPASLPFTNQ